MKYVIFDESEELIDIVDFSDVEKTKYEKANPGHYLELEDELINDLDEFDDNYFDDDDDFDDDDL